MSRPKGFPLPRAARSAVVPYQKNLLNRIADYMKNMEVDQLATFNSRNLYSVNDVGSPLLPNGQLKTPLKVTFGIYRIIDLNDKIETGRKENKSSGAREVLGGSTISYAVVPLEDIDKNGKAHFYNLPSISGATEVFDPRLVALSTYPNEVSNIAATEKAWQSRDFNNSFQTINTDDEFIPFSPKDYYSSLLTSVLKAYPQLLDNSYDNSQQQ